MTALEESGHSWCSNGGCLDGGFVPFESFSQLGCPPDLPTGAGPLSPTFCNLGDNGLAAESEVGYGLCSMKRYAGSN